jgi:hypothetical protein
MKGREIDASIVPFQNVLDRREGIERLEISRTRARGTFAERRNVPNAYGLVHRSRNDKVVFWVEKGGHDIMRVTGENGDAVSRCAVPDANRLIIGGRNLVKKWVELDTAQSKGDVEAYNPGHLVVELHGTHII